MYFCRSRWFLSFKSQAKLQLWQTKKINSFIKNSIRKTEYYQSFLIEQFVDLPYMDKSTMMENFSARNTRGIGLAQALSVAKNAEQSRNFKPTINDITVGMSSGTSGKPGVFLVSKQERLKWAGILLAKTLPSVLLQQILLPWRAPLRIAFFLRANSNLYDTLNSRRIDFQFFDLLAGLEKSIAPLNAQQPHALVAPATVLRHLALAQINGSLTISPIHIVNVAEVLEAADSELIKRAFGICPHQIYQATEGFLAYSCELGSLHLNETYLLIEREWLDENSGRFQPVITDFSRTTQLIVRYKLNDILQVAENSCLCGRAETTLAAIEGRADEVLWLAEMDSQVLKPVYPDLIRRVMVLVEPELDEYSIVQKNNIWNINVKTQGDLHLAHSAVVYQLTNLCDGMRLVLPAIIFGQWSAPALDIKRRRIRCELK
jgi:putative adenylate-forming enzyme